jgi:hypothetical protein
MNERLSPSAANTARWLWVVVAALVLSAGGCDGQESADHSGHDHSGHDHDAHDHDADAHDAAPSAASASQSGAEAGAGADDGYPMTTCVVAGEPLDTMGEPVVIQHEGREVRFCCADCVKEFKENSAKYLALLDAAAAGKALPATDDHGHDHGDHDN